MPAIISLLTTIISLFGGSSTEISSETIETILTGVVTVVKALFSVISSLS